MIAAALFTAALSIASILFLRAPAQAGGLASDASLSNEIQVVQMEPANYCLSCHTQDDPQLADPTAWRGGIQREALSPCPDATRLHEELYYTERLLLALDRGKTGLGNGTDLTSVNARISAASEGYARLLDTPIASLDAYVSEAQTLRFQMGKVFTQINQITDAQKKQRSLVFAGLVTLVLLVSLAWGIYNTRHAGKHSSTKGGRFSTYALRGFFLLLVFGLFALPLFRPTAQEVVSASLEEQAVTTALDTAQRAADAAERADGRAWMFSKIGAASQTFNPDLSQQSFGSALGAADQSAINSYSLWGEAALAREVSVGDPAMLEKAGLIANQLDSASSRGWALALIGSEWAQVDPAQAEEILEQAYNVASQGQGIYRDLDLRRIAIAWSPLNAERAVQVAEQVKNPGLRAWGLRELGSRLNDRTIFARAADAARLVEDRTQRARALREIALLSGDATLFAEARLNLEGLQASALAYALGDLAVASSDLALVEQIERAYPEARTLAYLMLGRYQAAWEAAQLIQDPYERGRAQAAIVASWVEADYHQAAAAAERIQVLALRERAMRDVIRRSGDASLVQDLTIAYYRVQALTTLGNYQQAWEEAAALKEPYPLVELGVAWAQTDPVSAAQVLDKLVREADKAIVLRALAAGTGDPEFFERALGMAQAARVRGDALAPAQATLDLFLIASTPEQRQAALEQAYAITQKIAIK
jgi:hypothetical protein